MAAKTTVAHCVAGLARSLPHPLVYRSLRRHMIDSFGGAPSVFLIVKTWNTAPKRDGYFPTSSTADLAQEWSQEQTEARLRPVLAALAPLVAGLRLVNASEDSPERLFNPHCVLQGRHYGLKTGVYTTNAGLVRMLGQAAASASCLRMIEAHERARGARFDLVTRLRPDLAYLAPVRPWHAFNFSSEPTVAHIHDRDWATVVHRSLADAALGSFSLYRNCSTRRTEETPEQWLRAAIRQGGGTWRVSDFPVGLLGVERCSGVCPLHASPVNASDPRQRLVVRDTNNNASAEEGFAGYFHGECHSIARVVGCFGDAPLHCRSLPCARLLASAQGRARFGALTHASWRGDDFVFF